MGAIHKLNAIAVKEATGPAKLSDGGGLNLRVRETGGKFWVFLYTRDGRAREMGLGTYPGVTLKEARSKAVDCRKLLDQRIDPIEAKRSDEERKRLADARGITFAHCAAEYIESHKAGWSNQKHAQQWRNTLNTYAIPIIGDTAVQEVTTDDVLRCLEPIWTTKTTTADRVRGRIESILDWARVKGYRTGENPARWRGHLDQLLPAKNKIQQEKHHAALPYPELPAFIADLRKVDAVSAQSLEFTILTALRTSEVLDATWGEFDLPNKLWVVPAERMKAKKEHRVPLSPRAMEILDQRLALRLNDHVFPSPNKPNSGLSNMAMLQQLRRMDRADITVHGFRSTFRDWVSEKTNYPGELAEAVLAHAISSKVEAAYRRGDMFEKRRELMDAWCGYCEATQGQVIPIGGRA